MPEETAAEGRPGLEEIVGCLQTLLELPHISEPYVRFRIDVLKGQWAVREALAAMGPEAYAAFRTETTASQGTPGPVLPTPLLGPGDIIFDSPLLRSLFATICESAATYGHQSEDLARLASAAEADPALLAELARKAAFGPDLPYLEALARQLRVLVDALLFVGRALAAPCVAEGVRRLAAGAHRAEPSSQTGGRCAWCGSPPSIARLRREDGRRILTCGLCGTSWESERLACPWCGTRDTAALTVLRDDGEGPRWVEACDLCRGYIKTVDERRLPVGGTIIPVVEETATLYLDLLAEREGYIRRIPYVLSG